MSASHVEISLVNLPPDIIRMIIPVGQSRRMRLITQQWNMLALEYLEKKRPIKSVDIHPGNTMDDLKVEMTISEKDLGYFDVAHWDFTGSKKKSNGQTKIGMISSPQAPVTGIREFFRANYLKICAVIVWMFCVISFFCCLIPFVIFISFIMAFPCAIYDCIIAPFLSLPLIPPPGPQPDIYVLLRRNEQYSQSVVTKRSELARNRLRMRLSLCSGIQVLRIKGIYLWTFDTLCHCLPLVNIGRMEIELASFNDHPDLNNPIYRRAFEDSIKELAQKHNVTNGVSVNGNEL